MKMQGKSPLYLYLLSGILMTLSFPPNFTYFFAFIAFIPLIFALSEENSIKRAMWSSYLTFFIYHTGSNWWIMSFQKDTDPYLMLSGAVLCFAHPLFFMFPVFAFMKLKDKVKYIKPIYLFPFVWICFEWLHGETELSYPWLTFGYSQIKNTYWIQFIDITGIWGASFLILLVNALILDSNLIPYFARVKNISVKKLVYVVLIFVIPLVYGFIRIEEFDQNNLQPKDNSISNQVRVTIVQPNINPWLKWESNPLQQIYGLLALTDSVIGKNKTDIAIWPETAFPFINNQVNSNFELGNIQEIINKKHFRILTGFSELHFYKNKEWTPSTAHQSNDTNIKYDFYNAAVILDSSSLASKRIDVYQKMRLTPIAERIPHAEIFSFAQKWLMWGVGISNWGKGYNQHYLNFKTESGNNVKIAPIICIESIYPRFVSNFSEMGANLFSIITNDAWYDGTPGPRQHYYIACARAIENRRYIVRCANTGVSGIINPTGNSNVEIQPLVRTGSTFKVYLLDNITIYAKLKDWLPFCSLLLIIALRFIPWKIK